MANTNGMQVGGGYYWNASNWEVEVVPSEGGRLKEPGAKYVKVPFLALFVIVPLLGATFLMFMPVIGFALFGYAMTKKAASAFTRGATDLAATVQPGQFAAGAAYFTGKPEEKKEGAEAPKSAEPRGGREGDRRPEERVEVVSGSQRADALPRGRGPTPAPVAFVRAGLRSARVTRSPAGDDRAQAGPHVPVRRSSRPRARRDGARRARSQGITPRARLRGGAGSPPRWLVRGAPGPLHSGGRCSRGRSLELDPEDLREAPLAERAVAAARPSRALPPSRRPRRAPPRPPRAA